MYLLRRPMLALADSDQVRSVLTSLPPTRAVVQRFVAGEKTADAVAAVVALREQGLAATVDHLGEYTTSPEQAAGTVAAYLELLTALAAAGAADGTEVSVKLSAIGQLLPDGHRIATEGAGTITEAAARVGALVNLDMEDHTAVDATLQTLAALRADDPSVAVAIQAMLRRTPDDLTALTGTGSRIRLVKGAYHEPETVAHTAPQDVDLAYVRALRQLMAGDGYPMVASHDPRMIAIAADLATRAGRGPEDFEYQMLYGIRADEQRRLVENGHRVRVYIPYGDDWYGYFTRRLAERPANLIFFLRALTTRTS